MTTIFEKNGKKYDKAFMDIFVNGRKVLTVPTHHVGSYIKHLSGGKITKHYAAVKS